MNFTLKKSDLNFKVYTVPSKPTAPGAENDIAIISSVTMTNWIMSPEKPSGMPRNDGDVWIQYSTDRNLFNALKQNALMIATISAYQYVDGAWVDREAVSFHGGEWVDWVWYFYRDGNTYNEVTGGWGHTKYESAYGAEAPVVFGSDRIKVTASTDNSYITFVHTKNKINISDINQISVKLDIIKEFHKKILLIDDGTTGNTPIASQVFTGDSAELDVSTYSGSYYVGVVFKNIAAQARVSEEYITEVFYSK